MIKNLKAEVNQATSENVPGREKSRGAKGLRLVCGWTEMSDRKNRRKRSSAQNMTGSRRKSSAAGKAQDGIRQKTDTQSQPLWVRSRSAPNAPRDVGGAKGLTGS